MTKKRKSKRFNTPNKNEDVQIMNEEIDQNAEDFFMDEVDKFHANQDKILLNAEDQAHSDDEEDMYGGEEEVLGYTDEDSDEDMESPDDEDTNEIQTGMGWGKKRSTFYGADTLEGLEGSDRDEAEKEEEEEVLAMQQRLAMQIDEDDLGLEILQVAEQNKEHGSLENLQTQVSADFSQLSTKAQWKIVHKESPELQDLVKDFRMKLSELETEVDPLLELVNKGKIPSGKGADYIRLKHRVYLAYLLNISFYLALKSNRTPIYNHPVVSRLVQYRTVINQLTPIDQRLKPQIEDLLHGDVDDIQHTAPSAEITNDDVLKEQLSLEDDTNLEIDDTKAKTNATKLAAMKYYKSLGERVNEDTGEPGVSVKQQIDKHENEDNSEERRAINQQIAKNKGITQKKRKIERNPRVKMREKFRKARIRRRGQVREYRPELKKYSGEASGIRAGLRKSVVLH